MSVDIVESNWGVELISLDIGNRYYKLVADFRVSFVAPSMLAIDNNESSDQPGYQDRAKFNDDPNWYLCGERITEFLGSSQPILFNVEARYWSPHYLKMVLYGLFRVYETAPRELHKPKITLSVPASIFANAERLKRVKDNLVGKHTVIAWDGKKEIKYRFDLAPELIIMRPEGAGSFYAHLINEVHDDNEPRWSKEKVAVASWGYLTLSCIQFKEGFPVSNWYKSNSAVGMKQIVNEISGRYGNPIGINDLQWEEMVINNEAKILGRPVRNFEVQRLVVTQTIAENGLIWLSNLLSTTNVERLLFVGGTVEYLDSVMGVPFWQLPSVRGSLPENVHKSYNPGTDDAAGHYLRQALQRGRSM